MTAQCMTDGPLRASLFSADETVFKFVHHALTTRDANESSESRSLWGDKGISTSTQNVCKRVFSTKMQKKHQILTVAFLNQYSLFPLFVQQHDIDLLSIPGLCHPQIRRWCDHLHLRPVIKGHMSKGTADLSNSG